MTWTAPSFTEHELEFMWSTGTLWPLLDPLQQSIYRRFRESLDMMFILDCSRRLGKSTLMLVCAHEDAIRRNAARVPFAAQTTKEIKEVLRPMCELLWLSCPEALRPQWRHSEGDIVFPNGSRLVLVGCDVSPDRLRGTAADSAYVDEAGFIEDLDYVVQSVLLPQFQGRPHARLLMGSTPPRTPAHPWTTTYVARGRSSGAYAHHTIRDNPRLSPEEIAYWIEEAGGPESTTCRREYMAEHVVDEEFAVVPEFRLHKDTCVRAVPRPPYFHAYVSLDPGWTHHTALLFAYWHFELAALVIEDDYCAPRQTSRQIAEVIREKERALWSACPYYAGHSRPLQPQPYRRISDTDLRLIGDLQLEHDLSFIPTAKDDLQAQVNALRLHVQTGRILIHPRCQHLTTQLEFAIWNKRRTTFQETREFGHFDCVAGGTLIATEHGDVPVERVRVGDRVMTRRGYRTVTAAWCAGIRETWKLRAAGVELVATADHRVWTEAGWKGIAALTPSSTIFAWESTDHGSPRASTGARTGATPSRPRATIASTSRLGQVSTCIARSGNFIAALFRRACTSITAMATRSTTISPIWNWSAVPSTSGIMPLSPHDVTFHARISGRRRPLPQPGTEARPASAGIENRPSGCVGAASRRATTRHASSVASDSSLRSIERWSAVGTATQKSDVDPDSTMSSAPVPSAASRSSSTSTARSRVAPVVVESVAATGKIEPVYDLTVEGEHEFFANGVLVHNCVAAAIYLDRNIDRTANPYPPRYFGLDPATHWLPRTPQRDQGRGFEKLRRSRRRGTKEHRL